MAGYYATKAYVLSLGARHQRGALGEGDVPLPGSMCTEFASAAVMHGVAAVRQPERDGRQRLLVADAGYRATMRGQRAAIPGRGLVGVFATRFVPRSLLMRIVERIQAKAYCAVKQVTCRTAGVSRAGR